MGASVALIKLILVESAKYFCLLLLCILAIRFWQRSSSISGRNRQKNFMAACLTSALAAAVGYFSLCHSLSLLYFHYGTQAFAAGNFSSALSLYQTSDGYWKSAAVLGRQGVCWLWLDKPEQGMQWLERAKATRGGQNSPDEEFFEGGYLFFHQQTDLAAPLLEAAMADPSHRWSAAKLLASVQLDKNQPLAAAQTMQVFSQVEVQPGEFDHAYVVASLDLASGKTNDAVAVLRQFPSESIPDFWKPRFEKLRAELPGPIQ